MSRRPPLPVPLLPSSAGLQGAASFLVGPTRQCRTMFAASRRSASLAYLGSIVCTLVCVFVLHLGLLALLSILVQSLALGWYTLSYIPYGQAAAKRILRRLLKRAGLSTSLLDAAVSSSSSSSLSALPSSPHPTTLMMWFVALPGSVTMPPL